MVLETATSEAMEFLINFMRRPGFSWSLNYNCAAGAWELWVKDYFLPVVSGETLSVLAERLASHLKSNGYRHDLKAIKKKMPEDAGRCRKMPEVIPTSESSFFAKLRRVIREELTEKKAKPSHPQRCSGEAYETRTIFQCGHEDCRGCTADCDCLDGSLPGIADNLAKRDEAQRKILIDLSIRLHWILDSENGPANLPWGVPGLLFHVRSMRDRIIAGCRKTSCPCFCTAHGHSTAMESKEEVKP